MGGKFELPWHRAFDQFIKETKFESLRGGDNQSFFIHVPNSRKANPNELFSVMNRVENGDINPQQYNHVDLVGPGVEWIQRKRDEPFIFIICSRNVDLGKFKDCWNSVVKQTRRDWGTIIIDGGSDNGLQDYIEMLIRNYRDKVTFVKEREPQGIMYSTWNAIMQYCSNPNSIIITLDADDALLRNDVLEVVKREYDLGADVTVGSMLRVDKEKEYLVDFTNPRENRGGNVWQHLRTFKKYLFDRIREEDLKIDGKWENTATDWLFMLPIVEMATNPKHIKKKLYYYNPGPEKESRRKIREDIISKIIEKSSYKTETFNDTKSNNRRVW
jgi:glycosyltransferase involved in cell wall biosynthesis